MSESKENQATQSQLWADRLADAKAVAEKLSSLPQEALLYIAGYAEGFSDSHKAGRQRPAN